MNASYAILDQMLNVYFHLRWLKKQTIKHSKLLYAHLFAIKPTVNLVSEQLHPLMGAGQEFVSLILDFLVHTMHRWEPPMSKTGFLYMNSQSKSTTSAGAGPDTRCKIRHWKQHKPVMQRGLCQLLLTLLIASNGRNLHFWDVEARRGGNVCCNGLPP